MLFLCASCRSAPAATPTPAYARLLDEQALIQDDSRDFVSPGPRVLALFFVESTSPEWAVKGSTYQVTIFDAAGQELARAENTVALLLPGQKLPVVTRLDIQPNQVATRMQVDFKPGAPVAPQFTQETFRTNQANYQDGHILATIHNALNEDVTDLLVTGIAYDAQGEITGCGFAFLDFVPAQGEAGVEIYTPVNAGPVRVEVYAAPSELTQARESYPGLPTLQLVAQHFWPVENDLGVLFTAENEDASIGLEQSDYQVEVYGASGTLLAQQSGSIHFVYPRQRIAVYEEILGVGPAADRVEIKLLPGRRVAAPDGGPTLSTADFTCHPADTCATATLLLHNRTELVYSNALIVVAGYDASGQIAGGGAGYVYGVAAGGQTPAAVPVSGAGQYTRLEAYAVPSLFPEPHPAQPDAMRLVDQRTWREASGGQWLAFRLQNLLPDQALQDSTFQVAAYDGAGQLLAARSGYIHFLFPGETSAQVAWLDVPPEGVVDRVELRLLAGQPQSAGKWAGVPLEIRNPKLAPDEFGGWQVQATVLSAQPRALGTLQFVAVLEDASGQLIGAGEVYAGPFPAGSPVPLEIPLRLAEDRPPSGVQIRIYPRLVRLSQIEE